MEKIKIFVSEHCVPCHKIESLAKKGQIVSDIKDAEIQVIDIESDAGFPEIVKENLHGVPVVKYRGQVCKLSIDEELNTIIITCQKEK